MIIKLIVIFAKVLFKLYWAVEGDHVFGILHQNDTLFICSLSGAAMLLIC